MPIMRLLAILLAASSSLSFRCRATLSLFWLCWMRNTDRKSTRLNSSHGYISYAVFCLKKKTQISHTMPLSTLLLLTPEDLPQMLPPGLRAVHANLPYLPDRSAPRCISATPDDHQLVNH